jgi:hypothetical protein
MKTVRNYVNSEWIEPENGGYLDVENRKRRQAINSTKHHLVAIPDAKIEDMIRSMMSPLFPRARGVDRYSIVPCTRASE